MCEIISAMYNQKKTLHNNKLSDIFILGERYKCSNILHTKKNYFT